MDANYKNRINSPYDAKYIHDIREIFFIPEIPGLLLNSWQDNEKGPVKCYNEKPFELRNDMKSISSMNTALRSLVSSMEQEYKEPSGLTTGFRDIDTFIGEFAPGDLVIVGGRPGMGKTSFVLNLVEHIAVEKKQAVLFKTNKLNEQGVAGRMASSMGEINEFKIHKCFLSDEEQERFKDVFETLSQSPIFIAEKQGQTFEEIAAIVDLLKQQNDLKLLAIDCLDWFGPTVCRIPYQEYIRELVFNLKELARRLKIVVLCTTILSRRTVARDYPRLSDIRGSDDIVALADFVLLIHRHGFYYDYGIAKRKGLSDVANIVIAKNRNGSCGFAVQLKWCGEYTRFYQDRLDEEYDDSSPAGH